MPRSALTARATVVTDDDEPDVTTIQPGDTVEWVNEDVFARRLELTGPEPMVLELEGRSAGHVVLHRLGEHDFVASGPLEQQAGRVVVRL